MALKNWIIQQMSQPQSDTKLKSHALWTWPKNVRRFFLYWHTFLTATNSPQRIHSTGCEANIWGVGKTWASIAKVPDPWAVGCVIKTFLTITIFSNLLNTRWSTKQSVFFPIKEDYLVEVYSFFLWAYCSVFNWRSLPKSCIYLFCP